MLYLLDSVILIDHFNGFEEASEFILKHHSRSSISSITRAEVLVDFKTTPSMKQAKLLLDTFPTIPISKEEADQAAKLRIKYKWKLPDALQAAVAKVHSLKLVTRNTKDFPPNRYDFVLLPYTLHK